jgi:hypothetical protein
MIEINDAQIDKEIKNKRQGTAQLRRTKNLMVGAGDTSFQADVRGIWLGAKNFEDAPFSVDMEGNVSGITFEGTNLVGATITGSTVTGGVIQTATTGKRLKVAGSPSNEYQFLDGNTKVGHLKIDDDGSGGYYAELFIDYLGSTLRVGSTVGASENVYFSTVGFSASQRAAVGTAFLEGKDSKYFGLAWSGGGDPILETNAIPTSNPGGSGRIWSDGGTLKIT